MKQDRKFDIAFTIIALMALIIAIYITKFFLSTIILGVVLVYLLKPIYACIYQLTKHAHLSSLLSLMVVFLAIIATIFLLTRVLLTEISNLQTSEDVMLISISNKLNLWIESSLPMVVAGYLENIGNIPAALASIAYPIVKSELSDFASNLPILTAQSLVAIFFTYYLLIDGKRFVAKFISLLPVTRRDFINYFLKELDDVYTALFTVYFTTAILSGLIAALGFFLLGIPYPLLWGTIIAVFALLPQLGPPVIFVPMILYYLLNHDYTKSFILLVFGIVLMVIPENVIRPQLAFIGARIHPLITVMAYTAPVFVVGIDGVIIGPALYGFLLAIYRTTLYYREK